MAIKGIRGVCPIGAVIGWLKSTTNMPTLANQGRDEWEELNGQTISDVQSPLNGQTLPDAIGTSDTDYRFLRFAGTSGGTGGLCCHCHGICGCTSVYVCSFYCCCFYGTSGGSCCAICCLCCGSGCGCMCFCSLSESHLPPYLNLVPLVRVK